MIDITRRIISGFCIVLCSISVGCDTGIISNKAETNLLAEVKDRKLYKHDVENMVKGANNPEDSIRILKGLIANWVKDQLMVVEAEKNLPKDINLEKMIEDYRSSLLLYNYETKITAELLDTLITKDQKEQYYASHSEEFELSESIAKYRVATFNAKTKGLSDFYEDWKKDRDDEIESFCKAHGEYVDLDHGVWRSLNQLESILPNNLISSSSYKEDEYYRRAHKGKEYFVKIYEYAKKESKPPFDFIEGRIAKIMLNERKTSLIKQKKQQLYDKESGSSIVKTYVN
jgi:hypothetical protein